MKNFSIIVFICLAYICKGQAIIIEEEFNGGTTAPAGWIFTAIGSTLNSNSNYGKTQPSIVMDATNDQVTSSTFIAGTANAITFWAQSTSGTPTSSDLISAEYFNGSWNSCSPASFTFNTTARVFEANFPSTATRVRITYTKSAVNVAIDDFTVLNKTGSCTTSDFLWFTGIAYNSCNANTCEGTDEYLTFQNGGTAMSLSDLEINVPGVGNGPEGTTFCGSGVNPCDEYFTTNATYVAALNAVAGCTGFFLSPPGNIIPANARVIVFMGNPPTTTINFGTLCGSGGNYYCVFVSNTTNCTGRYSNSSTALRFTTIRNRNTGCSVERSFIASNGSGSDGDIVVFDPGGAPSYVSNPGCTGFVALPIELVDFGGEAEPGKIDLKWHVASQVNTNGYIIDKSIDGYNWQRIAYIESNKELDHNLTYNAVDQYPLEGINYYRLKDVDQEGAETSHPVISVIYPCKKIFLRFSQNEDEIIITSNSFPGGQNLNLYDLSGRVIKTIKLDENNKALLSKKEIAKGLFLLGFKDASSGGLIKLMIY